MRETKNSKLTREQKEFIVENYPTMRTRKIANEIGSTYEIVVGYASNRKLKKEPIGSTRTYHYLEHLIEKRKDKDYNVYDKLNRKTEPKVESLYKSKYGKYSVNENYFNEIDNEWKAYWLGFLYADGYVKIKRQNKSNKMEYTLGVTLASVDKEHLVKLAHSLQTDTIIKDRTVPLSGKEYGASTIVVCNRKICNSLNEKGCTPNKSLTLEFPNENIVPKELQKHFIRGYFDGDGCIHINLENRTVVVNMVGTHNMLEKISSILHEDCGTPMLKIKQKKGNKAYDIAYGKYYDCERIYKYLYSDCNIYLNRKLEKFDTLFCLD